MTKALALCFVAVSSFAGETRFEFSTAAQVRIWGGGGTASIPRKYFKEDLPALFSRTLILDGSLPQDSALEWIFTGDEGGITLRIESGGVRIAQRYYDSYGLSATRPLKVRYPEKEWDATEASYPGGLVSVTVELDHRLGLVVLVNGKQVARQLCLLDVRRHQLGWTPPKRTEVSRVAGRMLEPETVQTRVTVNERHKHQTIYGFGGIVSAPAYARLSPEGRRRWWQSLAEYNLLIHREYPNGNRLLPDLSNFDKPDDATPHYYGDNFPNGEITDFAYIRQLRKLGGHVLFEFWDLPPWAREESKRTPVIAEYVRAMVGYCKVSQQKTGYPPDVVGVQNEIVQPAEVWHRMIAALREGLDRAGFQNVKIHMPDNSNLKGGIATAQAIQLDPAAWNKLDYSATHVYDFQGFFQNPDGYDATIQEWKRTVGAKPFLSTELTVNNSAYQSRAYRVAFAQAQLYHKNLALMDAEALLYCWSLLDIEQPSFGPTRSLFVPDRANGNVPAPAGYTLRVYGAFSRRVREGMVRVDATSENPHLLATAYAGKAGQNTAILINRGTATQRVRIDWPGVIFSTLETTSQYQANAVTAAPKVVEIRPGEILTLSSVPLGR